MDFGTIGNGGDHEDNDGGEELDSSGDLVGLKGGKKSASGIGQYNESCYLCGQRRHTAKNCESTATECHNCEQLEHMARSCFEKGKGKQGKGESKEITHEREKGKRVNVGDGIGRERER